jgi:hypothetical protein
MAARDVHRFSLEFGVFDASPNDAIASAVWPKRRRFRSSPVSRSGAAAGLASGWWLRGVGWTALPGEAHHLCATDPVNPSETRQHRSRRRIVHHAREIARWIRCSRPISGAPTWGNPPGRRRVGCGFRRSTATAALRAVSWPRTRSAGQRTLSYTPPSTMTSRSAGALAARASA